MDARRRVASVSALGGAIGAVAIDALYVNAIASQGVTPAGGRVLLVAAWIAVSALVAIIGAFTGAPSRRAWLLGWPAAALLVLSVPAAFPIGIPLMLCAIAIGLGALRAAQLLQARRRVAFLLPILMLALAAGALLIGFVLTAP
jgi:hypothetical protein